MDEANCAGCRQRDALIAELMRRLERVELLEQRIRELEARLTQNSSNSSLPPSANPLNAPKPVVKKKTGRRPGGQPGHPARLRTLLPPQRVTHTKLFVPTH